jgi:hypothetical protein
MVMKPFYRTLALLAGLCLTGCEIFSVTPFPDFVDKTDISMDLTHEINAIVRGETNISYQLTVVDSPTQPPRVLLLVEPPSSDPTLGFNYKGQLIFMDSNLNVLNRVGTGSSLDYFSKPYAYAHDNNVLAGYTVLTKDGGTTSIGTLDPAPGLEGFALAFGTTETDIFATPSGQYASFNISYIGYNTVGAGWGIVLPAGTLPIVPPAALPSTSDPNYANLGYQLVGLGYNSVTDELTFVLSEPAQGRIVAARIGRAAATSGSGVLLPSATSWPVAASAWPVEVDVDRPALFADVDGFFLVRRDGWMERYTWNAAGTPLALVGNPVKIVGDKSLSRRYAFLVPQAGGPSYMYRFDPSSRVLTRYRRWW